MEGVGGGSNVEMAGAGGSTGNSRWNPTKEQITILESLYKQGIRTPSADQIQQITTRLQAYGTIEGKNVFYWFQNHKARQRQKQKQENLAYINRYLHRTQPVYPPPPPCHNVVCGPYFVPQGDHHLGFYPQCPKVLIPCGSMKRRGRPAVGKMVKPVFYGGNAYDHMVHRDYNAVILTDTEKSGGAFDNGGSGSNDGGINQHETLPLFPLHPTGVCEVKSMPLMVSAGGSSSGETASGGFDRENSTAGSGEQRFFDFLSCQASSESD